MLVHSALASVIYSILCPVRTAICDGDFTDILIPHTTHEGTWAWAIVYACIRVRLLQAIKTPEKPRSSDQAAFKRYIKRSSPHFDDQIS